jgi:hypothetical protein
MPTRLSDTFLLYHVCLQVGIVTNFIDKSCIVYNLSFKLPLFTKQPTRGQVTLRATYHMTKENGIRQAHATLLG